jgi:hypothetical protein
VRKLPTYIRIGSADFRVEDLPDEIEAQYYGRIMYARGVVQFNKQRMQNQSGADTVLHEVLHGLITEYGLENYMAGSDEIEVASSEEQIVRLLAHGLTGFIRDNPDVLRWVIERVNLPIAGDKK